MNKNKLTLKQKRFADEYIISGNIYQSAIKAGYSENYAKNINKKMVENGGKISDYIQEKLKEIDNEKIAKQEEVLQYLTSVLRGESKSTIVVVEGCGDGVSEARKVEKAPDEKERLKAAELLGKRYGLFTEKLEIEAEQVVIVDDIN